MDMVSRAGVTPWPTATGPLLPIEKSDKFRLDISMTRSRPGGKRDLYEMGHLIEGIRRCHPLPGDYITHPLRGAFDGWMESHLRPDFLLIWKIEVLNGLKTVILCRCGPHSWVF